MALDRMKIARALQGLGAGIQGRGPQYLAGLAAEDEAQQLKQKEISAERRRAMALDVRNVLGHLEAGNANRALTLLNNRETELLKMEGADPSTTQFTRALIEEGKVEEAKQFLSALDREFVNEGVLAAPAQPEEYTLGPGDKRFRGSEEIASVPSEEELKPPVETPASLLAGLDEEVAKRADAAFVAAGGGAAGIAALNKQVELGAEGAKRESVGTLLKQSFPNASEPEMLQLRAAVDGATSVEDGMAAAAKIRTEQRRLEKAKGFQQQAVQLLDNILANPQLANVIGPLEGRNPLTGILDEEETDAIADINQAQNILTSDNMDLMTGVLSESDIKLLKNLSSGALDRTRSEKRFREDTQKLRDTLASKLVETVNDVAGAAAAAEGGLPVVTSQEQFDALPPGTRFIEDGVEMVKQ